MNKWADWGGGTGPVRGLEVWTH